MVIALIALFSQATLSKVRNSIRIIEIVSSVFLVFIGFYLIIFGLYETQYSDSLGPLVDVITWIFQLQGKVIGAVNSVLTSVGIL
jgi:predicted tellurium resistance membrane protein TerC